ncbi:MAG TPA: hypothetical protein VFP95_05215, partial [Gammaproteobacteria bacterium]|nr:hypothetical protein [Gammaproteobacteria bacterium]
AGIQVLDVSGHWIPAFAGMTGFYALSCLALYRAVAGMTKNVLFVFLYELITGSKKQRRV